MPRESWRQQRITCDCCGAVVEIPGHDRAIGQDWISFYECDSESDDTVELVFCDWECVRNYAAERLDAL